MRPPKYLQKVSESLETGDFLEKNECIWEYNIKRNPLKTVINAHHT